MYCAQCGARLDADARFCSSCGTRIEYQGRPSPARNAVGQDPQPYTVQTFAEGYRANMPPQREMPRVKNYLTESILCTVLCCLPFGIPGIVFAAQVDSRLRDGDVTGAMEASQKAKKWTLVSLVLGIVSWLISITMIVLYTMIFSEVINQGLMY